MCQKKNNEYVVGAATGVFEVNGKEGHGKALDCVEGLKLADVS